MLLYWIWFALLSGLSGFQKARLLERFSTPEELYHGGWEQLPRGLDPQEQVALDKKDLTQALHPWNQYTTGCMKILSITVRSMSSLSIVVEMQYLCRSFLRVSSQISIKKMH